MAKYILLNGPAGVGKDTLGNMLREYLESEGIKAHVDKFAAPLKSGLAAFLGLTEAEKRYYFETPEKDQPQRRFFNQTPRQALINLSEMYGKMTFGGRVFAKLCIERNADREGVVIITDCGFSVEADEVFKELGKDNVLLVRLERHGLAFAGDSREYIEGHQAFVVSTDGDVEESIGALVAIVDTWMGR